MTGIEAIDCGERLYEFPAGMTTEELLLLKLSLRPLL